jgi:hypothetical protein
VSDLALEAEPHPAFLEGAEVGPSSLKRFTIAAAIGMLVASVPYVWLLMDDWSGGYNPLRSIPYFNDFFDLQAESMLHGHLWVPPGSIGIEGYIHDGRTYTYFGLLPSLLRMPVILLAPSLKGQLTVPSMLVAWLLIGVFSALLIWRVRVLLRGTADMSLAEAASLGVLMAAIMGGSVLLWLGSQPWVYNEDISWSIAITMATLFVFVGILDRPSTGRIVAAGALLLAGALSRGTPALSCMGGALLIAAWLAWGREKAETRRWAIPMVVAVLVPLLVYFTIDLLKFGTLLSDPLSEQVWDQLNAHRRAFLASTSERGWALHLLPTGLWTYLQPFGLRVEPTFPFFGLPISQPVVIGNYTVDLTYPTASIPASMPLLFLLTCGAVVVSVRRGANRALRIMRIPLLVGLGAATIDLFLGYFAPRFLGDFLPLLALGGAIGMVEVWRGRHLPVLIRRIIVAAVVVLALFSMAVNVALAVAPTTEWTPTQATNYINTVKTISDHTGHPLASQIKQGFPLPFWAPAGEIFVVGNCAGLYISSGDQFDTVPLLQAEHKTWLPVEAKPVVTRTLALIFHASPTRAHLGAGVPVVTVGPDKIFVQAAGHGKARFVLKGASDVSSGPAFKPTVRKASLFNLEVDPTLREVIVSNGVGLVRYVSGVVSGGHPGAPIAVRADTFTLAVSSGILGRASAAGPPVNASLCRSLVAQR